MNLADFAGPDEIFVDANIFTYHVATCQHNGISHCATADAHFERVDVLQIWIPAKR